MNLVRSFAITAIAAGTLEAVTKIFFYNRSGDAAQLQRIICK